VVIDVTLAGICRTDIEVTRGYMNFEGVLGHECVGVVGQAGGAAGKTWGGRRVGCEINCVCGKCDMCMAGLKTHCRRRTVRVRATLAGARRVARRPLAAGTHPASDHPAGGQARDDAQQHQGPASKLSARLSQTAS